MIPLRACTKTGPLPVSRQALKCCLLGGWFVALSLTGCRKADSLSAFPIPEISPGLGYTNMRVNSTPWSIHVVRIDRKVAELQLESMHAEPGALGLSPLTQQIHQIPPAQGRPVAAVNGDFYQRDRAYAGDPRGLQIVNGELRSGPSGGVAFFLDATGSPRITQVTSRFQATLPDGSRHTFLLNAERPAEGLSLFTPAAGVSTHSTGGREWVLERDHSSPVSLAADEIVVASVIQVRDSGDTPLRPGILVLSAGPVLAKRLPRLAVWDRVQISTETAPSLRGVKTALGGGPVLVREGQAQQIRPAGKESYEFSSMLERHPRSAIGWNGEAYFLVTVDGRQPALSVGMTLDEFGSQLARLGCIDAMNLDGGGSATLWCEGKIRNSPCDGQERPVANGLVVLRK